MRWDSSMSQAKVPAVCKGVTKLASKIYLRYICSGCCRKHAPADSGRSGDGVVDHGHNGGLGALGPSGSDRLDEASNP